MDEPPRITAGLFVISKSPIRIAESAGPSSRRCAASPRKHRGTARIFSDPVEWATVSAVVGVTNAISAAVREVTNATVDGGESAVIQPLELERGADRDIERPSGSLCASPRASVSQAGCVGAATAA